MKPNRKKLIIAFICLAAFILWTILVCLVDVQNIGPNGSQVGLAGFNSFFHSLTGTNMLLYTITDWLGLVPFAVVMGFALLGLVQWIKRKKLLEVDQSILALGVFYVLVMAAYILFEVVTINYRPVLIEGVLEGSYPSSTTMLVMCVMPTAIMQLKHRIKNKPVRVCATAFILAFTLFMVVGRMISGVHWITDIIGGAVLSASLVTLYDAFAS